MELRRTLSTLALGGAVLVAVAGTASARGHEGWGGHRVGPFVEFNAPDVPYRTAYADGCGFYRVRWHETGRPYWLRRLEQCREYRG